MKMENFLSIASLPYCVFIRRIVAFSAFPIAFDKFASLICLVKHFEAKYCHFVVFVSFWHHLRRLCYTQKERAVLLNG